MALDDPAASADNSVSERGSLVLEQLIKNKKFLFMPEILLL